MAIAGCLAPWLHRFCHRQSDLGLRDMVLGQKHRGIWTPWATTKASARPALCAAPPPGPFCLLCSLSESLRSLLGEEGRRTDGLSHAPVHLQIAGFSLRSGARPWRLAPSCPSSRPPSALPLPSSHPLSPVSLYPLIPSPTRVFYAGIVQFNRDGRLLRLLVRYAMLIFRVNLMGFRC